MSTYTEPVIFHTVSILYKSIHERVTRFPKSSRHSLGARLENTVVEILEYLYLAQSKQGNSRALLLNTADVRLRILVAHIRLAHSTRCLNDAGYADLSSKTVEIGKMLGGWIKQTKTHPKDE